MAEIKSLYPNNIVQSTSIFMPRATPDAGSRKFTNANLPRERDGSFGIQGAGNPIKLDYSTAYLARRVLPYI